MTWVTVVIVPIILVYDTFYDDSVMFDKLAWLIWLSEISWCIKIVLNFFVASETHRDYKSIARNYLEGFFIFDMLSTFPPLLTLHQNSYINLLYFLRFVHIREMFEPIKHLINWIYKDKKVMIRKHRFHLIVLLLSALLLGHYCACGWIAMGTKQDGWVTKL